jgi:hypothetical protein
MLTKRDNMSLGCAGLALATTPALGAFKTSNALSYIIGGFAFFKAATDNIAQVAMPKVPAQPLVNLAANQQTCVFVSIDVAGNLFFEQAQRTPAALGAVGALVVPSITASGYGAGGFEWPGETKGYAVIGAIKIATNATGAYVFGTTALNAANQTVTYYNAAGDYGVPVPF